MRWSLPLLAAAALSPAAAASPIGEVICAPTDQMQERLTTRMNSTPAASGLRSPEEIVEIWTDTDGAWTMVIRYTSGTSCIVAMGDAWQAKPSAQADPGRRNL